MKQFALILFLLAANASAQQLLGWNSTGSDLITLCSQGDSKPGDVNTLLDGADCGGFILGVVLSHPDICVPEGVKLGQVRDMLYAYADKHPSYLRHRADAVVYAAIADGFGTKKGSCK
jgi:hypothetical protein